MLNLRKFNFFILKNMNYQEFKDKANKNEILIGIEPAIARKFFTDTGHSIIKEKINEPLYLERFIVKLFFYLQFLTLLAVLILSIFALKWYSIIAIPIIILLFSILVGKASMGNQKIGGAILILLVFFILAYIFKDHGIYMMAWLILVPLPYFFARLTYKFATILLRLISLRNEKVYDLLINNGITIKEE